jgi:murein DD-endopeptidase MepM/ murein hydrolase activator NlpD
LLKPEITQKVKSLFSANIAQELLEDCSLAIESGEPSGLVQRVSGSDSGRIRASVTTIGLALSMAISTFPLSCKATVATAAELAQESLVTNSRTLVVDGYRQHKEITIVAPHAKPQTVLIAQSLPPMPGTATEKSPFSGEVFVPILVPQPKSKTFKPLATAQPYIPNGDDGDTELYHPGDKKPTGKTGDTAIAFEWPTAGVLTSRFGRRWGKMHKGIDIAGPVGTPINSAAQGVVVYAGWSGGYGQLVEIKHNDGTTTRYGHNSRLIVSVGQPVAKGQQVSEMGSTGHSTGPHLHFEIRPNGGDPVNPIGHLPSVG